MDVEDKMDPVNKKELKGTHAQRKDKDIDNDGDVDSTDKYLHKRRKAITKNVKGKKGETAEMNPKMNTDKEKGADMSQEQKEETEVNELKTSTYKKYLKKSSKDDKEAQKTGDYNRSMKRGVGKQMAQDALKRKAGKTPLGEPRPFQKESTIRDKLIAVLERSKHYKGATKPEGMHDKESPGGKEMVNQPTDKDDTVKKGHDDASKAGRVTNSPKLRSADNSAGDKQIINKVKEAYLSMTK